MLWLIILLAPFTTYKIVYIYFYSACTYLNIHFYRLIIWEQLIIGWIKFILPFLEITFRSHTGNWDFGRSFGKNLHLMRIFLPSILHRKWRTFYRTSWYILALLLRFLFYLSFFLGLFHFLSGIPALNVDYHLLFFFSTIFSY